MLVADIHVTCTLIVNSRALFSHNVHGVIMGLQKQSRKSILNNLLTSNVQSLQENLTPRPCCIDLAIARSILQGLGLRFSRKDLTLG